LPVTGTQGTEGHDGEQFYVTHCAVADSVLDAAGYTVRAASTRKASELEAAIRYPTYELPIDLGKEPPQPSATPRRLARTEHSAAGAWVAHSVYRPTDTGDVDRSSFTHLLHLADADPLAVLRSWGAGEWCTAYPPVAPQQLPQAPLPVGSLVNDAAVTAFLGNAPAGPTDLSTTVCPQRLRGPAAARRSLFARLHFALLRFIEEPDLKLYVHAEPGLVALLLYGAARLLPQAALANLTFSTFEPHHRNIRDYKLARVVGTYLGTADQDPDLTAAGLVLDTFAPARSSPELLGPLTDLLPPGSTDLVELASRNGWARVDELHHSVVGGEWDARGWLAAAGSLASGKQSLPGPEPAASLPPEPGAATEEVFEAVLLEGEPAAGPTPKSRPGFGSGPPSKAAPVLPPLQPVGGMTYCAQISRTNPACLLFLIDQSKSMADPFPGAGKGEPAGGTPQTKAATVADALNRLLQNVVLRSAKADGVRDYFRVGVIGYGQFVKACLGGSLPNDVLVPVSKLSAQPLRVESRTKLISDGAGGTIEQKVKFPVWFDPEANGQTPMCAAFEAAGRVVKGFVDEFPDAYPPIVLNLTDGIPSDGNPQLAARLLCNQGTSDGAALLFNLLISSKPVQPDYFPSTDDHLTDLGPRLLFRMSSILPPKLWEAANAEGHGLKPRARGVVINADPTAIVRFLDIGTRVTPSGK
jgi:hypothetical protein